jgi:pyruvate formate lyase activating enzyme
MRYDDLKNCTLCEHRCGVNRLVGETGVCRMTLPQVASATLHPAPPESYTVFMAGCNFKCLNCQNWTIAHFPDNSSTIRGQVATADLAAECAIQLDSPSARLMEADRIFFSGGEPTIHLPYIEEVVTLARHLNPQIKVNFDTNGYMTSRSLERVLAFATSITFDIKAFNDEVHYALTGASSRPVLRNAAHIATNAADQLWEFRILVIPGITDEEILPLARFMADLDCNLPVCFLAFRPNFVLAQHQGASAELMRRCVNIARNAGLKNVSWAGQTDIYGKGTAVEPAVSDAYVSSGARQAASWAHAAGCFTHPRNCIACDTNQTCPIKTCIPNRST